MQCPLEEKDRHYKNIVLSCQTAYGFLNLDRMYRETAEEEAIKCPGPLESLGILRTCCSPLAQQVCAINYPLNLKSALTGSIKKLRGLLNRHFQRSITQSQKSGKLSDVESTSNIDQLGPKERRESGRGGDPAKHEGVQGQRRDTEVRSGQEFCLSW